MHPIRVAIVAPSVFPVHEQLSYGGAERVVHDLVASLGPYEIDYTLFAPQGSEAPGGKLEPTVEATAKWQNEEAAAYDKYKDKLKDFDVISDHTHQGYPYFCAGRVPVLHTLHGLTTWREIPGNHFPPRLVALSQSHAEDTRAKLGNVNTRIIHHGCDTRRHAYAAEAKDYFLALSVLLPHKAHAEAIMLSKLMGQKLVVAGENKFGVDPNYAAQVKDLCASAGFEFVPGPSQQRKVELLQGARALLLPFQFPEAFSLLAIEALSCGTPVITYDRGGMGEIIDQGKTGFLCKSPEEFGAGFLKSATLKRQDCRDAAVARFSRERMAKDYVDLFYRVAWGDSW